MRRLSIVALTLLLAACGGSQVEQTTRSGLLRSHFQTEIDGRATDLYTLTNSAGMEVCITNLGGRVVSILTPDRAGKWQDVVLGFDNVADYVSNPTVDFGATIGRYANRIANGRFVLEGDTVQLPLNNNGHTLHGGPRGWQTQIYDARQIDSSTLELVRVSPDGDENFPGTVTATVVFHLRDDNAFEIDYKATTDWPTVINMTNHSYFNLSGNPLLSGTEQTLMVAADQFTPIDSLFIPSGEPISVENTPFDFRQPRAIASVIDQAEVEQLANGLGFDHNWVLTTAGDTSQVAARLHSQNSGITLDVHTNEPGIQVYTGNFLDSTLTGKQGITYPRRASVCLETQHFPNSPNHPTWPSVTLHPGESYHSVCIYKFSVE